MVVTERLRLDTKGEGQLIDITDRVAQAVRDSGLAAGTATVFVAHTTAAVAVIEHEPGLVADLTELMERLAPRAGAYRHNLRPEDKNGHAHLRATLLGPSVTVPFEEKGLLLGTWQQIVVVDFDVRPRQREVIVQVMGE